MIAGRINSGNPNDELKAEIYAISARGPQRFIVICQLPRMPQPFPEQTQYNPLPSQTIGGFVERTWAYLTIKKLLEEANYGMNFENKTKEFLDDVLKLSIKVFGIFLLRDKIKHLSFQYSMGSSLS
jgi:hypothetical protein